MMLVSGIQHSDSTFIHRKKWSPWSASNYNIIVYIPYAVHPHDLCYAWNFLLIGGEDI